MLFAAALLLAAQAAPADASPDRAMLDAFRAACGRIGAVEHAIADAEGSGWERADGADPRVQRLIRIGREAVRDAQGRDATFRRTLAGRQLFLVISRAEEDGVWGNGCRVYHFEAAARIDPGVLAEWMGRGPTGTQDVPDVGVKMLWEPGWRDGVTVEINHVPATSRLRERYGLSGNILVAQTIGGF